MDSTRPISYAAYLRLPELLGCQEPPSPEGGTRALAHHDEMLFLVVHQVFELWFRQILHDLSLARDLLGRPDRPEADRRVPEEDIPRITDLLRRVNEIFRLMTDQFTVLETMPSVHFLAFRDLLLPASGFQSFQFRELEILAGLRDDQRLGAAGTGYDRLLSPEERERLARRREEMNLAEAVFAWLARTPVGEAFPDFAEAFEKAYAAYVEEQGSYHGRNPNVDPQAAGRAAARIRAQGEACRTWIRAGDERDRNARLGFLFLMSYRTRPLLRWPGALCETLCEFEERFRLFRFRHARMVERMIGSRVGTGGSTGIAYLDETARRYRIFGTLLEGVSFLIDTARLPPIPHPELLGFRKD